MAMSNQKRTPPDTLRDEKAKIPNFMSARRDAGFWGAAFIAVGVAAFAGALLLLEIIDSSPSSLDPWAVVFLLSSMGFFSFAGYALLRTRPFSVHDGLIVLPWPLRTKTGLRRKTVRVEEIESVGPASSPEGYYGLRVILRDGTGFYLWDPDLPPGAKEALLRLSSLSSVAGVTDSDDQTR